MSNPNIVYLDKNSAPRVMFSGDSLIEVDLPVGTRCIYPKPPVDGLKDVDAAIRYAVNHPFGCEPLYAKLRPGMKVVIAVDDISLPLPPMRRPDIRARVLDIVLDMLDEHGLTQDTIVVFTSDNGATHSPIGGTDVDFFESCGELRGRKGSMYEGGIRVPAIVRWPGKIEAGTESDRITGFEDWMPTLAELAGATPDTSTDGVSFAATLKGEQQAKRPFMYREFAGYGGWRAVWLGEFKLVQSAMHKKPKTELYNLRTDTSETTNLAKQKPDVVEHLMQIAKREHTPSEIFPLRAIDGK